VQKLGRVETPYIYRKIMRALAAHVPLFLTSGSNPRQRLGPEY
jgi:hypothetical protein